MPTRPSALWFIALLLVAAAAQAVMVSGSVTTPPAVPLAGASVNALVPSTSTVVASATTDSFGHYALSLTPGVYDFAVVPAAGSGYGVAQYDARTVAADMTLDFVLVPAGFALLSGRLLDGEGQPLQTHSVRVQAEGGGGVLSATTDELGTFSYGLVPGRYRFGLEGYRVASGGASPGYYNISMDGGAVEIVQDIQLDLQLPVHRVSVEVRDAAGDPAAGVLVYTDLASGSELQLAGIPASGYGGSPEHWPTYTDAEGRATLWLLHGAVHKLTARPADPTLATTDVALTMTGDQAVNIVLRSAVVLSGRLLDGEGNPLQAHAVRLQPEEGGGVLTATTDAAGAFQYGVLPGRYRFGLEGYRVASGGGSPGYYNLVMDGGAVDIVQDVQIDLQLPVHRVSIEVRDAAGQAIAGVLVYTDLAGGSGLQLAGVPASGYGGCPEHWPTYTDAEGKATLWLLHGAVHKLTARPSDLRLASTDVALTMSADRVVPIVLPPAVLVSGRLLDGEGNPLPSHSVRLQPEGGGGVLTATTDAAGAFQYGVVPGRYRFGLEGYRIASGGGSPGYYNLVMDGGAVDIFEDVEIDLQLPVHRVSIEVRDAAAQPVAGVLVYTDLAGGSDLQLAGVSASGYGGCPESWPTYTDAGGKATIWLLHGATHAITGVPVPGTPFSTLTLPGVTVSGDREILVMLQYAHPAPITTVSFSEAPDGEDAYPEGVLVTMTAQPAPTYVIAGTTYSLDGGEPQTYVQPFPLSGEGDHTLLFSSVDDSGVREVPRAITVKIRKRDRQPPTIHSVSASPDSLWPPNHQLVDVTVSAVVTDNVDPAPTFRVTAVSSSEREDYDRDGAAGTDWEITGPTTLRLRAERSGGAGPRIYTITIMAVDALQNAATATTTVIVRHDQR